MSTTLSTINGILKEVYTSEEIENLQNMETETLKRLPIADKAPRGKGFVFPVNLQGNQKGQGSQNELEALRVAGNQVPQEGVILPKVFTHTIRYSGLSLEMAKGNEDSFADTVTFQVEEGMKDSLKELNAQIFRDGSGQLALVNGAVVAGNSVVVDNGVITHFRVGEQLDFFNGAAKEEAAITITDVDIFTNTLTTATPVTLTDNDTIFRAFVNDNPPADGKEWAGLKVVTDDGTLFTVYEGIDRTVFNQFDGISLNLGAANLSNDTLERGRMAVKMISGRQPKKTISNTTQFRKYLDVVTPMKRFTNKDTMDSGYEEVPVWDGMEWIIDTDCDFDRVYQVDFNYLKRYVVYKLRIDETDGDPIRRDPGFDGFITVLKDYSNLGSTVPNTHVALTNLAVPAL